MIAYRCNGVVAVSDHQRRPSPVAVDDNWRRGPAGEQWQVIISGDHHRASGGGWMIIDSEDRRGRTGKRSTAEGRMRRIIDDVVTRVCFCF